MGTLLADYSYMGLKIRAGRKSAEFCNSRERFPQRLHRSEAAVRIAWAPTSMCEF